MESKGFLLLNECAPRLLCNSFEFRVNKSGGALDRDEEEEEDVGED